MSPTGDRPTNPETPWEFLGNEEGAAPDDDTVGAEDAAMHLVPDEDDIDLELAGVTDDEAEEVGEVVVHYLADEEPEVDDLTEPLESLDVTTGVDALLERQHYLDDRR